jgi:hypothetical protein
MIITICGSSKFKGDILEKARELTLNGDIVLMPHVFEHADNEELTIEQKLQLNNLHYQKILLSEAILVVNTDEYIGESTWAEIDWAVKNGKKVYFTVEPPKVESEEESTEETKEESAE